MLETKIKVDLGDIERLCKRYPEESRKARESKLTEAVALLEGEVKKRTPWGAGPIHLRDSIFGDVKIRGQKAVGILGTPLQHGEPVERGTKPHFPPIGPLAFWVEKKFGYTGKEARDVAFVIARAISKRGTRAARMFETGFLANEARVQGILEEIPAQIIKELGR